MRTYKDAVGDQWSMQLTIGAAMQLKQDGIDILRVDEKNMPTVLELLAEPFQVVAIAYAISARDGIAERLSPEEFAARIDGPTYVTLLDQLNGVLTDFFECLGRTPLAALVRRATQIAQEISAETAQKIATARLPEASTPTSGNTPAS